MEKLICITSVVLLALACGGGGGGESSVVEETPLVSTSQYVEETSELQKSITTLDPLPEKEWGIAAVRKVLHVFALGSGVEESKIRRWASMHPEEAITEILSFNAVNPNFIPEGERVAEENGTLSALSIKWSLEDGGQEKSKYGLRRWNGPAEVWLRAVTDSHLNPVRQRIGLLESNDHMAVHLDSKVESQQVFLYYDEIVEGLAKGHSYQKVLGTAALSAAIATQYNHRENRFVDGMFKGNEDFAREFHQLFFGILGEGNPSDHEQVSIRNTAKALTDIRVPRSKDSGLSVRPVYGDEEHYPSDLTILDQIVTGGNAQDKMIMLSDIAIQHEESLARLPLMIVGRLADPKMTAERAENIVEAWKSLPEKNLLALLRSYAISDAFHDSDRFRPWSVLERKAIIANRLALTTRERRDRQLLKSWELIQLENAPFRPVHHVFGSQHGHEALESSHVFGEAWEKSTASVWTYTYAQDKQRGWLKDWGAEAPTDEDGQYRVQEVGAWLWDRFIADGGRHYGVLEQAYVMSFLASGKDYPLYADAQNPNYIYSEDELSTDAVHGEKLRDLGISLLRLKDDDLDERRKANERIGLAVAFITMTPYMFGQEG